MKKNMGKADRLIRVIAAVLMAVLFFTNIISGSAALILGILGLVFLLTASVGFCPLYVPLGISTCKENK